MVEITNDRIRRRVLANLFHGCLTYIVGPLVVAGKEGVFMTSGDGKRRRCHPILASYIDLFIN